MVCGFPLVVSGKGGGDIVCGFVVGCEVRSFIGWCTLLRALEVEVGVACRDAEDHVQERSSRRVRVDFMCRLA